MADERDFEAFMDAGRGRRMDRWMEFVRIPSVSAQPDHADDCRRAADWLAEDLIAAGLEHVAVEETAGNPIVYGDWLGAADGPTVIVYGHYDVQPADPLELWETPPFEPVVRGDRMIGRGAEDNKSCVQMHVRAIEALLATRARLPLNVKLVIEGEEESGSPSLDGWLAANRGRLAADVAVISDTDFFDGNLPAICLGVRGITAFDIDVRGPNRDLHSGAYGGAVQNPLNALCSIIAALKHADGRIAVPGFYDDVVDLDPKERTAMAALPFDEGTYQESLGVSQLFGEAGYSTVERKTGRPTLDVNGMWGGYSGPGPKMIVPAEAHAKVSCRLVPDQVPGRVFEQVRAFVAAIAPPGTEVTVRPVADGLPSSTPIDHPATQAAARAIEATFGVPPLYYRAGGSVPVTASFGDVLGLPVVLLGFAPPDSQAHAPNEFMSINNFETGIRTIARCWEEMAAALVANS